MRPADSGSFGAGRSTRAAFKLRQSLMAPMYNCAMKKAADRCAQNRPAIEHLFQRVEYWFKDKSRQSGLSRLAL
jgi:hypothetical protein